MCLSDLPRVMSIFLSSPFLQSVCKIAYRCSRASLAFVVERVNDTPMKEVTIRISQPSMHVGLSSKSALAEGPALQSY